MLDDLLGKSMSSGGARGEETRARRCQKHFERGGKRLSMMGSGPRRQTQGGRQDAVGHDEDTRQLNGERGPASSTSSAARRSS